MKFVWGAVFLILAAALFVALARTWRARTRRQAELVPPVPVPAGLAAPIGAWDGFVVASTFADAPLERITAGGLGFRARGGYTVHPEGVVLTIAGEPDRWIALDHVRGADRQTVAIDRVVEPGGLIRLGWTATGAHGQTDIDTYFRFPQGDAAPFAALQGLAGALSATTTHARPDDRANEGEQH